MAAAARGFEEEVPVVLASRRTTAREVPPGLDSTLEMQRQIFRFPCTLYEY